MRWVANMMPAKQAARAKARAGAGGENELTGIQPSAAFNVSIANEVYAHVNDTAMWPRMPVENVQVVLGRTSITDPYLEGVGWDVVACVFAPFGGTRTINQLKCYDVAEAAETTRKEEGPGGMLCVNAVASETYHVVSPEYINQSEKVKVLIAAIEDAVTPFFSGLPFAIVLEGSGSFKVTAGGGSGSGGSKQIRRPQWTTTLIGGTGGSGSGGYHAAPGGDGWRAHLLQQCKKLEIYTGGAAPSLVATSRSQPGYANGNGAMFIGSGEKTMTFQASGWGIQNRYPIPYGLAIYMGPFDGVKPTYIGSRNAYTEKDPLAVVTEEIYVPAVHPTSGGGSMGDNAYIGFDCPITLEHMKAVCKAGLVGACSERTYKNPYFVEGLNVDFDPTSYKVVWGFEIS